MTAAKLKASILQLAIQGKLVPKQGEWKTVKLGEVVELVSGRDLPPSEYSDESGMVPYITGASNFSNNALILNRWTNKPVVLSEKGDLLITCKGTIGEVVVNKVGSVHIARQIMALRPRGVCLGYLEVFIKASVATLSITPHGIIPGISRKDLLDYPIPLPPLAEQRRIVEKVEELMPLVEQYGKAEEELSKLNKEFPAALKKSILQAAIQGKLVAQDPKDEPATGLLKRITAEKAKLVKEGKIKKDKPLEPITDDEKPFELPKGWVWARLGEIITNYGQKKPNKPFCYIDVGSINNQEGTLCDEETVILPDSAPSRARKIVKQGAVLYSCVRPYLLNVCVVDRQFSREIIASTAFAVLNPLKGVLAKYLFYYLRSPIFVSYTNEVATGEAYPAINDANLYNGVIPLPPVSEQKRIVEKVEELFKIIDGMRG